jgi:hypothetical protein
MSEDFNEIIDFTIYEFLFDLKKETNYTSLGSLCNNLKYCFEFNTKLSNELLNIIKKLIKKLKYLYDLTEKECLNHIFRSFKDEKWKKHSELVVFMKKNLNICYL